MQTDTITDMKIERITGTEVLGTLVGTEIDRQIATAKAFPRDIKKAMKRIEEIATMSTAISESCVYALARKQKNEKGVTELKTIQGPSVRLAEIVTSQFGNIRSGARVIQNDGRTVTAQGFCHDLESNNFAAFEVKRKITTKSGATFSEDMQIVTGNAACKIAWRNAVFNVVPAALIGEIYEKLLEISKGTKEDLPKRRENAMKWFARQGVTDKQIFEHFDVAKLEDIDLEKLQILSGMKQSIISEEFTVVDLFPPKDEKKNNGTKAKESSQGTFESLKDEKK